MHRRSEHGFQTASGSGAAPSAGPGKGRSPRRRWLAALTLTVAPLLAVSSACLDRPIGSPDPVTTNIYVDRITQTSVDKIDLLFMIDNSASMSDKQAILQQAVPDLVNRLVNPICVGPNGQQFAAPEEGADCPPGQTQEFNPITDINIGVVSSSLGDVGANYACPQTAGEGEYSPDAVDMAHLMGSLERSPNTANDPQGFLAWRAGTTDLGNFNTRFQRMVADVGENGCGWEASLESWYRFLVDPFPYRQLVRVPCEGANTQAPNCVQQATDANNLILLDDTLLAQRDAFLRDDSLVAIIMLTDENDCSLQVGSQTWVVAAINNGRTMFRGSSICATNPNDPCCYSCPLGAPAGCQADSICNADTATGAAQNRLPAVQDGQNLRCYQQKRRFGVDFLYPTQRYVNALNQTQICWNALDLSLTNCAAGNVVPNPLYAGGRQPTLVFLGGIIGVPWQAIDTDVDANMRPIPEGQLRFQNAAELNINRTWDEILGEPAASPPIPPSLPQMVESEFARTGVVAGNLLNGHDYDTSQGRSAGVPDDLEYSCIFPLRQAPPLPPLRDCATLADPDAQCDCKAGSINRPLCEEVPGAAGAQGTPGTVQYWAKAYPGTRHLEVLKGYGDNSIVASICAREVEDTTAQDYGYRPAIAAIVDRLKEQLGDRCLTRPVETSDDGTVQCNLVETIPQPDRACNCDASSGRRAPDEVLDATVRGQLAAEDPPRCAANDPACNNACLCEVLQVQQVSDNPAGALEQCLNDPEVTGVEGWCYVDADRGFGSEALVENCPATQRRLLRFVGSGLQANSTTFVACTGSSFAARN
jgi:hypothetical protein